MADPIYELLESPVYNTAIRAVQDSDPALASAIFTPLFTAMLNNTHFVKLLTEQVAAQLSGHVQDKQNPHGATAEQVGADPAGSAAGVQSGLDNHTANKSNPHGVTAAQVGAAAMEHTHTAAQVGADPAGSAAGVQNSLNAFVARRDNPHGVTAEQVGALPYGGPVFKDINFVHDSVLSITSSDELSFGGAGPNSRALDIARDVVGFRVPALMSGNKIGELADPESPTDATNKEYVDKRAAYDVVIRTQAEFEALIASPTWLGAVSVCFVGDGGTLKFTRSDGQGIKIPQTVKQIQGLNSAMIEVSNFSYDNTTSKGGLWYETLPTTDDYWIDGMNVSCTHSSNVCVSFHSCTRLKNCIGNSSVHGFHSCTQLINCIGSGYMYGFYACSMLTDCIGYSDGLYAFCSCTKLANCTGTGFGISRANNGGGFYDCTQLTNCTSISNGYYCSIGFANCTQLINCTGTGTGGPGFTGGFGCGFNNCTQLINCIGTGTGVDTDGRGYGFYDCTQLTNCTGTGSGVFGYGFYRGSYFNGCKQGDTAPTTAFLGGTNTHVDTATVAAS